MDGAEVDDASLERRLLEYRDLVERLLEEVPAGFLSVDDGLRITFVNRTAERTWGYRREELIGRGIWEVFPDAATPEVADAIARLAATRQPVQFETFHEPDRRWIQVVAFPLSEGFSAFFVDVTERRMAEREREAAEARYRDLVEEVPAITYLDEALEGRTGVIYVSPQCKAILGYSPEEWRLNANLWLERLHPDDRATVVMEDSRCRREGASFEAEYRMLARDGRVVWVHDRATPVLDEAGRPRRMHGVMVDITEHRAAEELIARKDSVLAAVGFAAERLLRSDRWEDVIEEVLERLGRASGVDRVDLFELRTTGDGIHVTNRCEWCGPGMTSVHDRVQDVRVPWMDAWLPVLRTGRTLVATADEGPLCFPSSLGFTSSAVAPLLVGTELWGILSLGETSSREWSAPELEAVAGVAAAVAAAIGRQRTERDLRQSFDALARSNEQRKHLLARLVKAQEEERQRVASDIHDDSIQIMTAVGLRLAVLRGQLADPVAEGALAGAEETVSLAIRRLRRLLFELHPMSLDNSGLAAAIEDHARLMEGDGPELVLDDGLDEEPPPESRTILYRIVQEALANVRKHANARQVRVGLRQEGGGVRVTIRDDGDGFDPSARPNGGPGHVGLPSMRERATEAGGWFRIDSAPGAGTTVVCWVPRVVAEVTAADPGSSAGSDPA